MSFSRAQRRRLEKAQRQKLDKAQRPKHRPASPPTDPLDDLRQLLQRGFADPGVLRSLSEPQLVQLALERLQTLLPSDISDAYYLAQSLTLAIGLRAEVLYAWALFFSRIGRRAVAANFLDELLSMAPDHPLCGPAQQARAGLSGEFETAFGEHLSFVLQVGEYDAAGLLLDSIEPNLNLQTDRIWCQHFLQGSQPALQAARYLHRQHPDDAGAACLLFKLLFLNGRRSEAWQLADKIWQWPSPVDPVALAEVAHFQGKDERVLALLKSVGKNADARLHHYAAVSLAWAEDWAKAQKHWQKAIKLDPGLLVAHHNLANARLPLEERAAPWPFDMHQLLAGRVIHAMASSRDRAALLDDFPELAPLVPLWLDRGGPSIVFALASILNDRRRRLGLMAARLFMQRRGTEMIQPGRLPDYRVDGEGPDSPTELPEKLELPIGNALRDHRNAQAEGLARQALEQFPDDPKLLNHLAVACIRQKREREGMEFTRHNHQVNPDYLFARTALAGECLRNEDPDGADAYLAPLRQRPHFHIAEFSALCEMQLRLSFARQDPESGEEWADAWEAVERDYPAARYRPASLRYQSELREAIISQLNQAFQKPHA